MPLPANHPLLTFAARVCDNPLVWDDCVEVVCAQEFFEATTATGALDVLYEAVCSREVLAPAPLGFVAGALAMEMVKQHDHSKARWVGIRVFLELSEEVPELLLVSIKFQSSLLDVLNSDADAELRAGILRARGDDYYDMHQWRLAVSDYSDCISCLKGLTSQTQQWAKTGFEINAELGAAFLRRGDAFRHLGQIAKAIADCTDAIELFQQLTMNRDDMEEFVGGAHLNRSIAYRHSNNFDAALRDSEIGIATLQRLIDQGHVHLEYDLATAYTNQGIIFRYRGLASEAITVGDRAISILERLLKTSGRDIRPPLAMAHMTHGLTLAEAGQSEKALIHLEKAISGFQKLVSAGLYQFENDLAGTYLNRGNVHVDLLRMEAALSDFNEATERFEQLIDQGRQQFEKDLASALLCRANAYSLQNEHQKSILDFEQAIDIVQKLIECGRHELRPMLAACYTNRGGALARSGKHESARADHTMSLSILGGLIENGAEQMQQNLAVSYLNRADSNERLGRAEEAEADFGQAVNIFQMLVREFSRNDLALNLAIALNARGSAAARRGRWPLAMRDFEAAVALLDESVIELASENKRLAVMAQHSKLYDDVIAGFCRQVNHESIDGEFKTPAARLAVASRAAFWCERGRARNLADIIASADAPPQRIRPEEYQKYIEKQRNLRHLSNAVAALERYDSDNRGSTEFAPLVDAARAEWHSIFEEIDKQRQHFIELDPDWVAAAPKVNAEEMYEVAETAEAALLSVRATVWGTCAVVVCPDGHVDARLFAGLTSSTLDSLLFSSTDGLLLKYEQFRSAPFWSRGAQHKTWQRSLDHTMHQIGELLWKPLCNWLRRFYSSEHFGHPRPIVVLAGRGLNAIPLHAAWWEEMGVRRFACDVYQFTYAPSLSVLRQCLKREEREVVAPNLMAIRNPTGDLHWAGWEVDQVCQFFDEFSILDGVSDHSAATRENIKAQLPNYSVGLFSTHGQYDVIYPWSGSGLFTADGGWKDENQPYMKLADIFGLNLQRLTLAVMTACESALTDVHDNAVEQLGLPSALLAAGATTTVGSMWAMDDFAAALVSVKMFEFLCDPEMHMTKGKALWMAQRWLRELDASKVLSILNEIIEDENVGTVQSSQIGFSTKNDLRESAQRYKDDVLKRGKHPFNDLSYWAGLACHGAFGGRYAIQG